MRVGNRGTSPVAKYSENTGIEPMMPASRHIPANTEKNKSGLKCTKSENTVLTTLKPSVKVLSFDVLPSGRLLYSTGSDWTTKLLSNA